MSKYQIAFFTFTLGKRESIGPAALNALWVRASGTQNASVGRKVPYGNGDRPVYTLYGPQHLPDLPGVEARLRKLFEAAHLTATLTTVHA